MGGADINPHASPHLRLTTRAAHVSSGLASRAAAGLARPREAMAAWEGTCRQTWGGALLLGGCLHGLGVHVPPWGNQHLECGCGLTRPRRGVAAWGVDKAWLQASALLVFPQGAGPPLRQGEGKAAPSTQPLVPEQVAGFRAHRDVEGGQPPDEAGVPGTEAMGRGNTSRGHWEALLLEHAQAPAWRL